MRLREQSKRSKGFHFNEKAEKPHVHNGRNRKLRSDTPKQRRRMILASMPAVLYVTAHCYAALAVSSQPRLIPSPAISAPTHGQMARQGGLDK